MIAVELQPFDIPRVKENLIGRALSTDDLDFAIEPIQKALGFTRSGDASFFAALGQQGWRRLSADHRRTWLAEWLRQEIWGVEA